MKLHVYAPKATEKRAVAEVCPDCKKRTRMLEFFTPWFGWDSTCIRCGRKWKDGEWMPLDFSRAARRESVELARAYWRSMPPRSANHFGIDA